MDRDTRRAVFCVAVVAFFGMVTVLGVTATLNRPPVTRGPIEVIQQHASPAKAAPEPPEDDAFVLGPQRVTPIARMP